MEEINDRLIPEINAALGISIPATLTYEELHGALTIFINEMINSNFEKLIFYLYRIDINEGKMRQLLNENQGEGAASTIATMIIDRQLQKAESRKNNPPSGNIADEEKW